MSEILCGKPAGLVYHPAHRVIGDTGPHYYNGNYFIFASKDMDTSGHAVALLKDDGSGYTTESDYELPLNHASNSWQIHAHVLRKPGTDTFYVYIASQSPTQFSLQVVTCDLTTETFGTQYLLHQSTKYDATLDTDIQTPASGRLIWSTYLNKCLLAAPIEVVSKGAGNLGWGLFREDSAGTWALLELEDTGSTIAHPYAIQHLFEYGTSNLQLNMSTNEDSFETSEIIVDLSAWSANVGSGNYTTSQYRPVGDGSVVYTASDSNEYIISCVVSTYNFDGNAFALIWDQPGSQSSYWVLFSTSTAYTSGYSCHIQAHPVHGRPCFIFVGRSTNASTRGQIYYYESLATDSIPPPTTTSANTLIDWGWSRATLMFDPARTDQCSFWTSLEYYVQNVTLKQVAGTGDYYPAVLWQYANWTTIYSFITVIATGAGSGANELSGSLIGPASTLSGEISLINVLVGSYTSPSSLFSGTISLLVRELAGSLISPPSQYLGMARHGSIPVDVGLFNDLSAYAGELAYSNIIFSQIDGVYYGLRSFSITRSLGANDTDYCSITAIIPNDIAFSDFSTLLNRGLDIRQRIETSDGAITEISIANVPITGITADETGDLLVIHASGNIFSRNGDYQLVEPVYVRSSKFSATARLPGVVFIFPNDQYHSSKVFMTVNSVVIYGSVTSGLYTEITG